MSGLDLVRTARPILEELAERTRESANLGVLSGDGVVYVDQVAGSQAIVTVNWVGRRTPLHATSNGKVLLAFMDDAEQDRHLAAPLDTRTPRPSSTPRCSAAQLGRGPPRGYAQTARGARGGSQRGRRPGAAGRRPRDRGARRLGTGVPDARASTSRGSVCWTAEAAAAVSRQLGYLDGGGGADDDVDWAAHARSRPSLLDAIGRHPARPPRARRARRRAVREGRVVRPDRLGEGPDLRRT